MMAREKIAVVQFKIACTLCDGYRFFRTPTLNPQSNMKLLAILASRCRKVTVIRIMSRSCVVGCALCLSACLSVDSVASSMRPVESAPTPAVFVMTEEHDITLDTGYHRGLARGSKWVLTGEIDEGQVYKPENGTFTIEGSNVVEAYLVVSQNRLVGFYVPSTKGFSPLDRQVPIAFEKAHP